MSDSAFSFSIRRNGKWYIFELFPTALSTSVDSSSSTDCRTFMFTCPFFSRLKTLSHSTSSYPEYTSEAGSSFTNLEVCSISSQQSLLSNLS
ncbi:hypothetical protein GDO86_004515 [Hymenochirus boettgeri]|uniref:Uncharacterized protein n=1 Tax=Hymenochirus boettgeri TaxID=247094 RepID=A0A8T2K8N5_9PIPI|nr:hypothetical protein GDO86_004515 [Hymenochirus boettgeri]